MKKIKISLIILSILITISIIMSIYTCLMIKEVNINDKDFNIRTIESKNCSYKPILYYEEKDYNIYTYCLDSILIINDNITELKDYIDNDNKILNKILSKLSYTTYLDGGTKEYKNYKIPNISNNGITILKCNGKGKLTKDIYIGTDKMYYKFNFCLENNETFIKTYKIIDIEEHSLNEITLTLQNQDSIDKVTINTNQKFKINSSYEFEFIGNETNIKDNIESIFEKMTIVEIREIK